MIKHRKNLKSQSGFTLIELLIAIGILAILMGIVLIAINPGRQFKKANDIKRHADINAILNAINQYEADSHGVLPAGITTTTQNISDIGANICTLLVPRYLAGLPQDPLSNSGKSITDCSGSYETAYTVVKSAVDNRVTVTAPNAELESAISVTR